MRLRKAIVILLVLQGIGLTLLLIAATGDDPEGRAISLMAFSLVLVWVVGFGALNVFGADQIIALLRRIPGPWRVQFVLACTLFALIEEGVTTSLSNLSQTFGDPTGEAMITASTNYLDVVFRHSVIIFVPMFAGWAWLLGKWRFSGFAVFLLFGITGMLAETVTFGPQMVIGFGQWICVYGLMVYLPTRAFAPEWPVRPRFWSYPFAVVAPIVIALPFIAVIALTLGHTD